MTATTTERFTKRTSMQMPARVTLPAAASTLYLKGTIACIDANDRAAVPTTPGTDGVDAVGVHSATVDNSAGANDAASVEIEAGVFGFLIDGATPSPGDKLYVVDNQTVSASSDDGAAGTRGFAGVCTEVRGGQAYLVMSPVAIAWK